MSAPTGGATDPSTGEWAGLTLTVRGMTCGSCVAKVGAAVERLAGVEGAEVALAHGTVQVRYQVGAVQPEDLCAAIRDAGYDARVDDSSALMPTGPARTRRALPPLAVGATAGVLLAGFYVAVVAVAQDWNHAVELIGGDWYYVAAIAAGFGTQVGLFARLRQRCRAQGMGLPSITTGAGTGTSTLAMLACCAHHAGELLALLGISAAAVFLNEQRVPIMLVGIAANIVGIAILWRMLHSVPLSEASGA